jgi:hypothetical protein
MHMTALSRVATHVEPPPKRRRVYRSLAAHLVQTAASSEALAPRIARAKYPWALAVLVAREALQAR